MARYYFDLHDGQSLMRDTVGSECKSPEDVRSEAMDALPQIAKDAIPKDGDRQAFIVLVRNENDVTVYTASVTFFGTWIGADIPPKEEPFD